eukprot:TRINITY_DN32403_c0_g1_i1.p1 TRINITY_DN32403_c0_g1~~TRINITY_DN32403_c0_g1_i1.p1  ORF type:complete len:762 (+),score=209.72 TRINITY_DN32403_c0_g1_i1:75-2360(+)
MGSACFKGDGTSVYQTESTIKDKEEERRARRRRLEEHQERVFREDEFQSRQHAMWKQRGLEDIVSLCGLYPMPVVISYEGGEIGYINPLVHDASGNDQKSLAKGNHLAKLLQLEDDDIDTMEWFQRTPMTMKHASGEMVPANVINIPLEIDVRPGLECNGFHMSDDEDDDYDERKRNKKRTPNEVVEQKPMVIVSFIEPLVPHGLDTDFDLSIRSPDETPGGLAGQQPPADVTLPGALVIKHDCRGNSEDDVNGDGVALSRQASPVPPADTGSPKLISKRSSFRQRPADENAKVTLVDEGEGKAADANPPPLPPGVRQGRSSGVRSRTSSADGSHGRMPLSPARARSNSVGTGSQAASPGDSDFGSFSSGIKPLDLKLGALKKRSARESISCVSSAAGESPRSVALSSILSPRTGTLRVSDPFDEAAVLGDVQVSFSPETGVITWASHAAVNLFGHFDLSNVVNKPLQAFLAPGHGDRIKNLAQGPPMQFDGRAGTQVKIAVIYDPETSETVNVQIASLMMYTADQSLVRFRAYTPKKKSVIGFKRETGIPDELGGIVEALADATVVVSKEGGILCCNKTFEKLFECSLTWMADQDISIFVPDAFQSRHRDLVRRHMKSTRQHKKFMKKHRAMVGQTMASREVIPLDITIAEYYFSKDVMFYICTCRKMFDLHILQRFNETAAEMMEQVGVVPPENFVLTHQDQHLAAMSVDPLSHLEPPNPISADAASPSLSAGLSPKNNDTEPGLEWFMGGGDGGAAPS